MELCPARGTPNDVCSDMVSLQQPVHDMAICSTANTWATCFGGEAVCDAVVACEPDISFV